jgi:rod shape-determining protein MreD
VHKVNKRLYLYGLLVVLTVCQAAYMKRTPWFPDLMLLVVVFTGIFRGHHEAITLGIIAGFLRGSLSLYMLPLDIFLFPAVGATCATLTKGVYRQNPVINVLITTFAVFAIIAFHTFYLKIITGNEFIGVWNVFRGSLRAVIVTVAISPLFFFFLRGLSADEELE